MDRRKFLLSAASSSAAILAASTALAASKPSTLILGDDAVREFEAVKVAAERSSDEMNYVDRHFFRLDVYDPKIRRWNTMLQVPVINSCFIMNSINLVVGEFPSDFCATVMGQHMAYTASFKGDQ